MADDWLNESKSYLHIAVVSFFALLDLLQYLGYGDNAVGCIRLQGISMMPNVHNCWKKQKLWSTFVYNKYSQSTK